MWLFPQIKWCTSVGQCFESVFWIGVRWCQSRFIKYFKCIFTNGVWWSEWLPLQICVRISPVPRPRSVWLTLAPSGWPVGVSSPVRIGWSRCVARTDDSTATDASWTCRPALVDRTSRFRMRDPVKVLTDIWTLGTLNKTKQPWQIICQSQVLSLWSQYSSSYFKIWFT